MINDFQFAPCRPSSLKCLHPAARRLPKLHSQRKKKNPNCVFILKSLYNFHFPLPVNGWDAGNSVIVADALCQKSVSDLPGKHGWVLSLVVCYFFHNLWRGYFGFRPTNYPWFDAASLIVSAKQKPAIIKSIRAINGLLTLRVGKSSYVLFNTKVWNI